MVEDSPDGPGLFEPTDDLQDSRTDKLFRKSAALRKAPSPGSGES